MTHANFQAHDDQWGAMWLRCAYPGCGAQMLESRLRPQRDDRGVPSSTLRHFADHLDRHDNSPAGVWTGGPGAAEI